MIGHLDMSISHIQQATPFDEDEEIKASVEQNEDRNIGNSARFNKVTVLNKSLLRSIDKGTPKNEHKPSKPTMFGGGGSISMS